MTGKSLQIRCVCPGREADLERETSLCLEDGLIRDSIVVCADVIEHLMNPNPLLGMIHRMLIQGSKAVVLTTPERDLTYGIGHSGPPPNLCHVREWNLEEFWAPLEGTGFKVAHLGLILRQWRRRAAARAGGTRLLHDPPSVARRRISAGL